MPLPTSGQLPEAGIIGEIPGKISNSELLFNTIIPAEGISLRTGFYNNTLLQYFDLDYCRSNPSCSNSLNTLTVGREYTLVNANSQPILTQLPILSQEGDRPSRSPFRRIYRVTVPDSYQPNAIRSESDVFASQYRIEATAQVLNHPITATGSLPFNLQVQQAWYQNQSVAYLNLGVVPYSTTRDQLGTGVVYFMRNRDRSELPSRPGPIFDTVPGELLYSPVRQVFRAIAENLVSRPETDPSLPIRSQEALLAAVNRGEFTLEDTRTFFNYPVSHSGTVSPTPSPSPSTAPKTFRLRLNPILSLPRLEAPAFYALLGYTSSGEKRLLARFRVTENGLLILNAPASQENILLPAAQLNNLTKWQLQIEAGVKTSVSGSVLLQGAWQGESLFRLTVPFASSYQNLNSGTYMLSNPLNTKGELAESGLWFMNRNNTQQSPPRRDELAAGLVLPAPPQGWRYNGWIRTGFRPLVWLPTGSFTESGAPDQGQRYYQGEGWPFPGEIFLKNAPEGLLFPFNLPSTGDSAVVLSLEPAEVSQYQPFYPLFTADIAKGIQAHVPQALRFQPPQWPTLEAELLPQD